MTEQEMAVKILKALDEIHVCLARCVESQPHIGVSRLAKLPEPETPSNAELEANIRLHVDNSLSEPQAKLTEIVKLLRALIVLLKENEERVIKVHFFVKNILPLAPLAGLIAILIISRLLN